MAKSKSRRDIEAKQKLRKSKRRKTKQRTIGQLENLEPRQLLSVTPLLNGNVATFSGDDADDVLQLRVNDANQLEFSFDSQTFTTDFDPSQDGDQSLTIDGLATINVSLGDGADQLTLSKTLTDKITAPLTFDGGTGIDSLAGPDGTVNWSITAKDKGSLAVGAPTALKVNFTSAENLTGGSGADSFSIVDLGVIGDGGEVSGNIDGGGGTDVISYSQFDHEVSVSLADSIASRIANFAGIESFVGGKHDYSTPNLASTSTSAVKPGERVKVGTSIYQYLGTTELASRSLAEFTATNLTGVNYLDPSQWRLTEQNEIIGPEEANTWSINAADGGSVGGVSFSNFQDVVGGPRADTFNLTTGGTLSGTLDGGGAAYFDFTQQSEPASVQVGERVVVVAASTTTIYQRTGIPLNAAAGQKLDLATEDFAGVNWSAATVVPDHVDVSALTGAVFELATGRVQVNSLPVIGASKKIGKFTANAEAGDTVVGTTTDTIWKVNGPDTVKVNATEFVDVETLTGSAAANDQFVFSGATAAISTRIDGGAGGQDSFAFSSGDAKEIVQLTGAADQSGSAPNRVNAGNTITYANIDPLTLSLNNIKGTSDDDTVTVSLDNGNLSLAYTGATFLPLNAGVYGTATSTLVAPLQANQNISIDLLGGNDTLTFATDLTVPGRNLEVLAEKINVNANVSIDTRSSSGDAGSITLAGESIVLNSGAKLLAQATGSNKAGDITIDAEETGIAAIENLRPFALTTKDANVDIKSNVEIRGDDISIYVDARDKSLKSIAGEIFGDGLESDSLVNDYAIPGIPGLASKLAGVPVKLLLKKSEAKLDVGSGTTIAGVGFVDIRTRAVSDSSGEVESKFFSVGYVQAEALSTINFAGDTANPTNITSGRATVIRSDGKAKGKLKTKTARELGDAGANKLALSTAVANTNIVSKVTIPTGVNIVSAETANIKAAGDGETVAQAKSGLHANGVAGLAFSIEISNADIKAEVDGNVTANRTTGTAVKLEFDPTRAGAIDSNRINLQVAMGNTHDLPSGSPVEYTNRRGTSIGGLAEQFIGADGQVLGGLVDGETYYIVRDPSSANHIYLAESVSKARRAEAKLIKGEELSLVPFIGDVVALPQSNDVGLNTKEFNPGAVNNATDEITLENKGFTGAGKSFSLFGSTFELGQAVLYTVPNGGTAIGGLQNNRIYYVNVAVTEAGINGDDRFVDKQVIKLSETENKALAGVTLALDPSVASGNGHKLSATHVLDSGLATGLGVLAELDATNEAVSEAGLDSDSFNAKKKGFKNKIKKIGSKFQFADRLYDLVTRNTSDNKKYQKVQKQLNSKSKFSLAGSFSFTHTDHKVLALVGDLGTGTFDTAFDGVEYASTTANAKLQSKEDLEVEATISQSYQQQAVANNEPQDPKKIKNTVYTTDGNQKETAASGAITVGILNNQAKSVVQSSAQLDGHRATRVVTDVRYPYRTRPDEFIPGSFGELIDKLKSDANPKDTVMDYVDGSAFSDALNTYSRAFARGDAGSKALAGSVTFVNMKDVAQSVVKNGAKINQAAAFRGQLGHESVSVQSFNYKQLVNVTGVFDFDSPKDLLKITKGKKGVFGSSQQAGGFGGSLYVQLMDNKTHSLVEQGTQIYTGVRGGLDVVAEEAIMNFSLAQSGTEADGFGLSGTGTVVVQDSDTRAEIQDGVTILGAGATASAPDDDIKGSPITVLANSLETSINWAGALAKTNSKSFGISVAINEISRDTNAILGQVDAPNTAPRTDTKIDTTGAITVKANNDGALWAFTAAATIAGGSKGVTEGNESPVAAADAKKAKFGIGVSANVSWNTVEDNVNAYINDAGEIIASSIDVIARNTTDLFSLAMAAAVTVPSRENLLAGKKSATISGSMSKNSLDGKTKAYIKGRSGSEQLKLLMNGPVKVDADRGGSIKSIAAGLGVEVSRNDPKELALSVAGSVSINNIENETEAFVTGVQDTKTGFTGSSNQVVIDSTDVSEIFALAGGLSIALGGQNASAGFSLAWNEIEGHNLARLDDSKLSRVETLDVMANGRSEIDAISMAGSLAGGQGVNVSLAGSVSLNDINVETEALLSGTETDVASTGNVSVLAREITTIEADSGGFSIAASLGGKAPSSAISVGAAVAINKIGQTRKIVFNATDSSVVSVADNTLRIPNHSMATGQKVKYEAGDEDSAKAAIGGLKENTNYYVINVDADHIRIAASADKARANKAVDLTGLGGGKTHSFDQSLGANQPFVLNSKNTSSVNAQTDAITLPNHDMKTGQRIRYTAETKEFDPSKISSTAVNVATDSLTISNHGFENGDQVAYSTTGAIIGGVIGNASYFVGDVSGNSFKLYSDQARTQLVKFTNAGVGAHQLKRGTEAAKIFNSGDSNTIVSLADSSLRVAGHGWQNGQILTYSTNNSGDAIGGLTSGNNYYVAQRTNDTFKLATDTAGSNVITLSTAGTGTHLFKAPIQVSPAGSVLGENTDFYVIRESADVFKLAISEEAAEAGTAIDITANGGLTKDVITSFPDQHRTSAIIDDAKVSTSNGSVIVDAQTFGDKKLSVNTNQRVASRLGFNPSVAANVSSNEITIANHGLRSGDTIKYVKGHGDNIGGLTSGTTYFAEVITEDRIKIRPTVNGTEIDITSAPKSTYEHKFESLVPTIDTTENTIHLSGHRFNTGTEVTYDNGSSTAPGSIGGLANNGKFFVIAVDKNRIRLASSAANANSGTAIDLTSGGALGRKHSLTVSGAASGIRSLTMGGSAAVGGGGTSNLAVSAAGAFSLNKVHRSVEALVRNTADVMATTNITVDAADRTKIEADAGGISLGVAAGKSVGAAISVGASNSDNTIGNRVQAKIENSKTESTNGGVVVTANSQADIDALTIAGSAAVGASKFGLALSGAGTGSYNTIANVVDASIGGGTDVDAESVSVLAEDRSDIDADAGGVALAVGIGKGAGALSVGLSISEADIDNNVRAAIEGTSTNVLAKTGAAIVSAKSNATIDTVTLGGALAIGAGGIALSAALSGAVSLNDINTDVDAVMGTGSTVAGLNVGTTAGVQAVASDDSTTTATTIGASLAAGAAAGFSGTLAIAASVSHNTIDNDTHAHISGATVAAASNAADIDVIVDSRSNPQIKSTAVAASLAASASGGGGLAISGAGAESRNTILGSTKAFIASGSQLGNTIDDVTVTATVPDTANIDADVVSVAGALGVGSGGAGAVAIGVSLADNYIGWKNDSTKDETQVHSYVQASTLNIDGNLKLDAQSNSQIDADVAAISAAVAGAAGGSASGAGSGSRARNRVSSSVHSFIEGGNVTSNVTSAQPITLNANDKSTIDATVNTVAVAANVSAAGASLSVAATEAFNIVDNNVQSYFKNATINVPHGGLKLDATEEATITSDAFTAAVAAGVSIGAGAAGSGTRAENTINSSTSTSIQGGRTTVANDVELSAKDTNSITSKLPTFATAGGFVAVAGAVSISKNTANPNAGSYITGTVTSSTGDVKLTADSNTSALAETLTVSIAAGLGVAGAVVDANSTVGGTTEAYVGPGGNVTATNADKGNVNLVSNSRVSNTTKIEAGAGSLLGSAVVSNGTAENNNNTQSYVTGTVTARNLDATADILSNTIDVNTIAGSGGFISATAPKTTTNSKPKANAFINGTVDVTEDVNLRAIGRAEADAKSRGFTGGGVAINASKAVADISPAVDAYVGSSGNVTANNVNVRADLVKDSQAAPSDFITSVDTAADTVDIQYPLQGGNVVEYELSLGTPIGGLTPRTPADSRQYNVLDTNGTKVRLGNSFNAESDVDVATDTITFNRAHNFESGDKVVHEAAGGTNIFGVASPALYVRVVDDLRIRLVGSQTEATAEESTRLTAIGSANNSTNTVTVTGNAFVNGQAITYRSQNVQFANESVDVTIVSKTANEETTFNVQRDSNGVGQHTDNNNLFVPNHGFSTGDQVRYEGTGIGLTNGASYYVISKNANEIQLAATRNQATGDNSTTIAAVPLTTPTNQTDSHRLARNIEGLLNDTTYYVVGRTANTVQLAATPGGAVIPLAYTATEHGAIGSHRIGNLGLDLQAGTGSQTLRMDLTTPAIGTLHKLLSEGGTPLASALPVSGDGYSSIKAEGGVGGLIAVGAPDANLTAKPVVKAHIDGAVKTDNNVSITANSETKTAATANATSGGLFDGGRASSTVKYDSSQTEASVGGSAKVEAGNNFTVVAESGHDGYTNAVSRGGGAFSSKKATSTTNITDQSQATIHDGGSVIVTNLASMRAGALTGKEHIANARGSAKAAGAGAISRSTTEGKIVSENLVRIGKKSTLMAGQIDVHAFGQKSNAISDSRADAYGAYAEANPTANRNTDVRPQVEIDGDATAKKDKDKTWVRGNEGIDIRTTPATVTGDFNRHSKGTLIVNKRGGNQGSRPRQLVDAKQGAVIVAGPRAFGGATTPLFAGAGMSHLGLYVNNVGSTATTTWDAEVLSLLSQPTAELTISPQGGTTGLHGEYFSDRALKTRVGSRLDGTVDFNWGSNNPGINGVGANNFSVRWTGTVQPNTTGNYEFRTESDDGVRLWVNGQLLIDKFAGNISALTGKTALTLNANQRYDIRLEYLESSGGARVKLLWKVPGTTSFATIPTANLAPPNGSTSNINHTYDAGSNTVTIDRINRPGKDVAQVLFAGAGTLTKSANVTPQFKYQAAYDQVKIDVQSNANVVLNTISAGNSGLFNDGTVTKRPGDDVRIAGPTLNSFEFDVLPEFQPPKTDKDATHKTTLFDLKANGAITINGAIDNPLGTTSIVTSKGDIVSGPNQLVRTNELTVRTADGNVGSSTSRFNAELVVTDDECVPGTKLTPTKMTMEASQNVFTDVRGLLRATRTTPPITTLDINIDTIDAGGSADVRLLEGLVQTTHPTGTSTPTEPEFNFVVDVNGQRVLTRITTRPTEPTKRTIHWGYSVRERRISKLRIAYRERWRPEVRLSPEILPSTV